MRRRRGAVLQLLQRKGGRCRRSWLRCPRYVIVKDKLDRPNASLDTVYEALRGGVPGRGGRYAGRAAAGVAGPVGARAAVGTEPIVRVIAEAPDEAAARELVRRSREPLDALGGTEGAALIIHSR